MTKIRPPWLKYLTVDELYTQLEHELLQFQAPTGSGCTLTADQRGTRVTWSPVLPQFEAMQSVKTLPLANQNFITHFRNWLHLSNLGSVVRLVYSHVARLAFSLLQRDWRGIDPKNDLAQVETHIRTNCDDARGLSHLINGLTAFGQYLVVRQQRSLLPGGKLAHMQWPETQPHNPFNDCLGDSPQHDSPISGCVPPKNIPKRSGSRYCRLPRMVRAALAVNKLNLVPLADWPSANQFFYQHFRNWLRASGYGDSAQYLYGLAARIAFSLIKKDWRDIDPTQDLTQVRTWISQHYDSVDTQHTYFKGLAKLADYLQRRQHRQHRQHRSLSAPVQAPNPRPYSPTKPNLITVAALPNPIRRSLEGYLAHCQRNWPSVQSAELGIRDRRQEMSRDWWSRITLPLRQMQTMGLPIASPADLTPTVWYAYVDARLANGIAQSTLNGTLFSLKGWLSWLDDFADTDDPQLRVDPRMLKLQPLRQPSRVPKDVPIDDLIKLQRVIELEAINPNPHTRWRGTMDLAWFLLMLHAGLRTGEVRRLRLDDIDWSRRHIRIEASKHLKSRIAPFSQHAATALNNWITLRTDSTLIAGVDLPNTVFFDRHVSLSESYCYSRLSTYGGRCNVKVHPHQLRHSCATLLLNAGMPLPQVQAVLGHVSIETTRGYARSYDGTVAADYTRAMLSVEQDLQLTPDPTSAQSTPTPAQVIALLDSLKTLGVLNPQQRDALAQVRAALIARSRQV